MNSKSNFDRTLTDEQVSKLVAGDKIVCCYPNGLNLTLGKEYHFYSAPGKGMVTIISETGDLIDAARERFTVTRGEEFYRNLSVIKDLNQYEIKASRLS